MSVRGHPWKTFYHPLKPRIFTELWGTSKGVYRGYMGVCRAYIGFRVWGFPKLRVPFWGFPTIRIIVYWALGSPCLWNCHLRFSVQTSTKLLQTRVFPAKPVITSSSEP